MSSAYLELKDVKTHFPLERGGKPQQGPGRVVNHVPRERDDARRRDRFEQLASGVRSDEDELPAHRGNVAEAVSAQSIGLRVMVAGRVQFIEQ